MAVGDPDRPVATVIAGGRGSRLGGAKATVQLAGRPLIDYAIDAGRAAGLEVVVVAKPSSPLPPLAQRILHEPEEPVHPLTGVVAALREFQAIVAIPCDMPFISPALLARLARELGDTAVTSDDAPFPALFRRSVLPTLEAALAERASMRGTIATLTPHHVPVTDVIELFSVNTPDDLARAQQLTAAGEALGGLQQF